jgi:nucleoside-diphosphate-sugar epimerase
VSVYEPGTQSRNYIHVKGVAEAYVRSAEKLLEDLDEERTGVEKYEIASDEDPSVMAVAELVRDIVAENRGTEPDVELVENPRAAETLVDDFGIDTDPARRDLDWEATRSIEGTIRELVRDATE